MQEVWTDHGIYVLNRVFIRGIPNTVIYPTNDCSYMHILQEITFWLEVKDDRLHHMVE